MRIVYMGTPDIAVSPLQVLHAAGRNVVGVVTQPDRPGRRSRKPVPPPVKLAAEQLGIPVYQPDTLKDPEAVAWLRGLQPDVGVVAAYGEILRREVLDLPPHGFLNIHPSILPLYRGPAPVTGAILGGDDLVGVSVMRLVRKMDAGPILAQMVMPLAPNARAGELTATLMHQGATLLNQVLDRYVAGELELQPQADHEATYTQLLSKQDGQIDWSLPALVIERMIRAYDPWPATWTTFDGQPFKILEAELDSAGVGSVQPGSFLPGDQPSIATGSGALRLVTVQPAGKRAMSAADWRRGARDVAKLGS